MRTIKKKLTVKKMVCRCYDTKLKKEVEVEVVKTELDKEIQLPDNHVLIEANTLEEKEVTYTLSPQDFVKYARIEE